ncbi:hypothetical protein [Microtetraspora glauca]|uniref:DUF106 domain-containing protein n=1 Tax=Microtetraspora glauca TaxID=1996 RepID=A0ABV3GAA6_MICGL
MPETEILTWVIKWTGVAITLIGLFIVAPHALLSIWRRSKDWIKRKISSLLQRPQTVHVGLVDGGAVVEGVTVLQVGGFTWDESVPVEERIARLRAYVESVESRLNNSFERIAEERTAREQAVSELEAQLRKEINELRGIIEAQERESLVIDTRGLVPIVFGVIFGNVPEFLATWPAWHLAWFWPFLGFGLTVMIATKSWTERTAGALH